MGTREPLWIGLIQETVSGFSTPSMSRLTTTASLSLHQHAFERLVGAGVTAMLPNCFALSRVFLWVSFFLLVAVAPLLFSFLLLDLLIGSAADSLDVLGRRTGRLVVAAPA
jgi:hypothetical protein